MNYVTTKVAPSFRIHFTFYSSILPTGLNALPFLVEEEMLLLKTDNKSLDSLTLAVRSRFRSS
jgi:hypothetical protein